MDTGHVKNLLDKVQEKGQQQYAWWRFRKLADNAYSKECLLRIVTIMLTDEPVKRTDLLLGSSADSPNIGDWEGHGLVLCEIQVKARMLLRI